MRKVIKKCGICRRDFFDILVSKYCSVPCRMKAKRGYDLARREKYGTWSNSKISMREDLDILNRCRSRAGLKDLTISEFKGLKKTVNEKP